MRDQRIATREQTRHLWSARIKKLVQFVQPGRG
jgi:hypothetical protein